MHITKDYFGSQMTVIFISVCAQSTINLHNHGMGMKQQSMHLIISFWKKKLCNAQNWAQGFQRSLLFRINICAKHKIVQKNYKDSLLYSLYYHIALMEEIISLCMEQLSYGSYINA